jgi:dihydrofolate reductase
VILRGLDDVRALRDRPGRLGVTGSISVAQQLVEADLIDEYRLFVYPVLVGDGPGVPAGGHVRDLDFVEATSFPRASRSSATSAAAEAVITIWCMELDSVGPGAAFSKELA